MKYNRHQQRDTVRNYFPLPNEFLFGSLHRRVSVNNAGVVRYILICYTMFGSKAELINLKP